MCNIPPISASYFYALAPQDLNMTDQQKQIERVKSAKATAQILFSVQDEIPGFVDMYMRRLLSLGN